MQKISLALVLPVSLLLLLGCVSQSAPALPPVPSPPQLVGNDSDAHGCIGSAGYIWCEEKQRCLRAWEENCTASGPGKGAPCNATADCPSGAARCADGACTQYDGHGCVPDGGYAWCPEKAKCLRMWEEGCPSLAAAALEAQAKASCASGASVYICGEYIRVASGMPGAGSSFYSLGNSGAVATCPVVAPDSMSEQCKALLYGGNCVEKQVACRPVPAAVTDLKDDPSFVGAQLTWSSPGASAADYAIYRGDEGMAEVSLIKTTGQKSYNDVFNGRGKAFAYFVRARNADGAESPISNIVYVTQRSAPSTPSPGQND
ncbi:MAG: hypothetical protein WC263_00375 [Candidatus Micrarchaeia archaeon]|jgi:hypothetical protein